MSQGPLKDFLQEGTVVDEGAGSDVDRPLLVSVQGMKHAYKNGCIEESDTVRLHDMLFSKFAERPGPGSVAPPSGARSQNVTVGVMRFAQFCDFTMVCAGEKVNLEVYQVVCNVLGVHTGQGLTS
eukprot:1040007-Amphidinium_carterae.1